MTVKHCNIDQLLGPQIRIDRIYWRFFIHFNTYYAWSDFPR